MKAIKGRILYNTGDKVLLFKNLAFYSGCVKTGKSALIAQLPVGGIKSLMSRCRLISRLLRMEPRCAGKLDEHKYVVCLLGKLWLVDTLNGELSEIYKNRSGYGLVSFCENNGCLYWGDYGPNPNYEEINIYRLDRDLNVQVVYTFPRGSIRHIHNIIKSSNGFIVMAGDNEPKAGIYQANWDWTEVSPWKNGEQKYRAVVGFPHNGGLLYATDSVETDNYIRFVDADGNERMLAGINGSCIYGTEARDVFLFSTTVEPHEGGGLWGLFSNKLGGGIKSKDVHIIAVAKEDLSSRIVKSYRKDIWPMKLFQYGRAPFAGGQSDNIDGVWCYPIACVGTKGCSELLDI